MSWLRQFSCSLARLVASPGVKMQKKRASDVANLDDLDPQTAPSSKLRTLSAVGPYEQKPRKKHHKLPRRRTSKYVEIGQGGLQSPFLWSLARNLCLQPWLMTM